MMKRIRGWRIQVSVLTLAFGALLTLLMSSPVATADVGDSVLTQQVSASGTCSYRSNVTWHRGTDLMDSYIWVKCSARWQGCVKKAVITFHDENAHVLSTASFDAPTACGTWDPTCASTVSRAATIQAGVPGYLRPYVSHITMDVVDRSRP